MFSTISFVFGLVLLFVLENSSIFGLALSKLFPGEPTPSQALESDVETEAERVKSSNINDLTKQEPFVVKNLSKVYSSRRGKSLAVRDLSFGVKSKECFGLLGLNGAGKTTTLKIITGELRATGGCAFVNGVDILNSGVRKTDLNMGFCPQFDYLPDYMTVKEILQMYANLRGLQGTEIEKVVDEFIRIFKLDKFSNRLSMNLRYKG